MTKKQNILYMGNVANNSYLSALICRKFGMEGFALSINYRHIMGCPEWEETFSLLSDIDHNRPDFASYHDLEFERPFWFVQGDEGDCLEYLELYLDRNDGVSANKSGEVWSRLCNYSGVEPHIAPVVASQKYDDTQKIKSKNIFLSPLRIKENLKLFWSKYKSLMQEQNRVFLIRNIIKRNVKNKVLLGLISSMTYYCMVSIWFWVWCASNFKNSFIIWSALRKSHVSDFSEFKRKFGESVTYDSFNLYNAFLSRVKAYNKIFSAFSYRCFCGTEPVMGLVSGLPYLAFEHGTIRHLPFQPSPLGILVKLAYQRASAVFITNVDNLLAAKKLGLERTICIPHPIRELNEVEFDKCTVLAKEIRNRYGFSSDHFVIFHPSRHDWSEKREPDWDKGNDIFLRGVAECLSKGCKIKVMLVRWGRFLEKSEKLIKDLGIESAVTWVDVLPGIQLNAYMMAADMIADQFTLGAFGSTTPKALMLGKPVLIKLDKSLCEEFFGSLPPVLNAASPSEVAEHILAGISNPEEMCNLGQSGKAWYFYNHSNSIIFEKFNNSFSIIDEKI